MYALTDSKGQHVFAGDLVKWSPGGAQAEVVEVGPNHAELRFEAPLDEVLYYHDITRNITKVETT